MLRTPKSVFFGTLFTIFVIFFGLPPALAADKFNPPKEISITIFPSMSPMSKKYDIGLPQNRDKLIKIGYSDDLNQFNLAFENRDQAWLTGQNILNGILDGHINNENISEYATPKLKTMINSNQSTVVLIIKGIKSYGDNAKLSTQYTEGMVPDYMVMKKEFKQDRIDITILDVVDHISYSQLKTGEPITYITIVLSADEPYKTWLLSGISIKKSKAS